MSELDRYVTTVFELIETHRGHALETAQAVRLETQRALASQAFVASCANSILASVENARVPWRSPPLWQSADPPLQLRVFYWPPGQTSDPHFHGQWTVTGVLHNEILVETFDSDRDAEANQAAKKFAAAAGEVGYLMPPCIHRLTNTSDTLSATFHVFSENAVEGRRPEAPRRQPQPDNQASPVVQRALHLVTRVLAGSADPSVVDLLVRAFALAGPYLRVQIIKALVQRDADVAYSLSQRLERSLSGADRDKVSLINREFAIARGFRGDENAAVASAGVA